ncbi:hypothetical protein PSACC_00187 [Paramicrosporidium saccamoebae]|uniref:SWR1-complex protein 4 n=1 Tax=Paramicrosporidium saccamoebae TaxID=1246581 RepID=A0A2H9TQJ5_9FUNG|nr:hypothetical protein PSACC_00187 [Paramicrosporidium saccamoebae]
MNSRALWRLIVGRGTKITLIRLVIIPNKPIPRASALARLFMSEAAVVPYMLPSRSLFLLERHAANYHDAEPNVIACLPYTDDVYETHLRCEDWSRKETDYLFDLCNQFNCRFVLVADRYNFDGSLRSMEDMRERYYQVEAKLSSLRGEPSYTYDKEGDRHRRLTISQPRDSDSLREEALLSSLLSAMRLDLPAITQARERLLLTCGGLGQQLLAHAQTLPELLGMRRKSVDSKNSKKNAARKEARKRRAGQATEESEIYGQAGPSHVGRKPKPVTANTLVRSADLKTIRVGLTRHVDKLLQEKGLCNFLLLTLKFIVNRPVVPTVQVCKKFDELRGLLAKMAEAQKNLDALMGVTSVALKSESTSRRPSRPPSPVPRLNTPTAPSTSNSVALSMF